MAKSNFSAGMPTQTAQVQPKGLQYFLYGPQLKAQTKQMAMQVAGNIDYNTTGVHQADMEYLGQKVQGSMARKNSFVDKILDGKDVTNQDVKSLSQEFRNSRHIGKEIQHARLNAQRIEKAKEVTERAGLARGDMSYYKQWLQESLDKWGGSFGKDGSPRAFELAEVPDYVDIEGSLREDMKLALTNMSPEARKAWEAGDVEVVQVPSYGGIQLMLKHNRPDRAENNYAAVQQVLDIHNKRFTDKNDKVFQMIDWRNDKDTYIPMMQQRMVDVANMSKRRNIREYGDKVTQGSFIKDPTEGLKPHSYLGNMVTNQLVQTPVENTNPSFKYFKDRENIIGSARVVIDQENLVNGNPGRKIERVPLEGMTEQSILNQYTEHRDNAYRIFNSVTDGATGVVDILERLDGMENTPEVKAAKDYLFKLRENNIDDLVITDDEYDETLLSLSSFNNRRARRLSLLDEKGEIKKPGVITSYKEKATELLANVGTSMYKDEVIRDNQINVRIPQEKKQNYEFWNSMYENAFDSGMTVLDIDPDKNQYRFLAHSYNDKQADIGNDIKLSGVELVEGVRRALAHKRAGKDSDINGFKIEDDVTVSTSDNTPLSFLDPEIVNGMTPEQKEEYDNALMFTVSYKDPTNSDKQKTFTVIAGNKINELKEARNDKRIPFVAPMQTQKGETVYAPTTISTAVRNLTTAKGENIAVVHYGVKSQDGAPVSGPIIIEKKGQYKYVFTDRSVPGREAKVYATNSKEELENILDQLALSNSIGFDLINN